MKKIKSLLISAVFVLGLVAPITAVSVVSVSAQSNITDGLGEGIRRTDPDADPDGAEDQVNAIITTVINIFSLVVGVISVIMIIIGGLKYITSGGDAGNVTGAKNTILYAVIGLAIVALSQIIVRFVLERVTQ